MVIKASGIARGRIRTTATTTTVESCNMAAILQITGFFFGGGGGGTKARICPTTLADSKWRPVPLKHDPKPDQNLPLWSQKWKENMLQNI